MKKVILTIAMLLSVFSTTKPHIDSSRKDSQENLNCTQKLEREIQENSKLIKELSAKKLELEKCVKKQKKENVLLHGRINGNADCIRMLRIMISNLEKFKTKLEEDIRERPLAIVENINRAFTKKIKGIETKLNNLETGLKNLESSIKPRCRHTHGPQTKP